MINPLSSIKKFVSVYVVLFLSFDVHMFAAALGGNKYIFDEVWYVPASIDTLHGLAANIEHPPLVKLLVGGSIGLFGDNWFAWRFPIVVCALVATWLVYKIARRFLSERSAVFASALMSLSVIFLLIGSTSMLDVPCIMFGLAGLYLALRGNYGLGGIMFGLSFLCKETAVLMFLATWIYLAYKRVRWFRQLFFFGLAFAVAFGGVWVYDVAYRPVAADVAITNPVEHFWLMTVWQLNLNGIRAPNASQWYPPVAWVTPFGNNAWSPLHWLWLKSGDRMVYDWAAQPNVAVEYMMFPLLALLPLLYFLKRKGDLAVLSWVWLGANFAPWLLAGFFVRTEANFYIAFSVPFLAIGSAYLYSFVGNRKLRYGLATLQVLLGLIWFLYYFPLPLFR